MSHDPPRLLGVHHVELWVGNARQAAYYYRRAFGFSQTACRGLETGCRDRASIVLEQGRVRLVVTAGLDPDCEVSRHVALHGEGVHDIAFEVDDADIAFEAAVARGAEPAEAPRSLEDGHGRARRAAVRAFGETLHGFVARGDHAGPFLPGFVASHVPGEGAGLVVVDHAVGNVEAGRMETWARWYEEVLGFHRFVTFDDKDISTEHSALRSVVMADRSHAVKLPINEPAPGRRASQIQEYLDYYRAPGVQHVALLTRDIVATVGRLVEGGVEFLEVPDAYYDGLSERVGPIDEDLDDLRRLGVLVDRDEHGYLLQLFTKPVQDRPTLFYEVIQRKGARGFGKGNFKALFEAIEREQRRRGNLS